MVRLYGMLIRIVLSAPHPRGDGPLGDDSICISPQCSPPAWGWSDCMACLYELSSVLPTRVGMVRWATIVFVFRLSAPHPRGDGPIVWHAYTNCPPCSPPAWGWSAGRR